MNKLKMVLFRSWFVMDTLEDRIYHIVLDVAVFVTVLSLILGLVQRQPAGAVITIGVTLLFLIVISISPSASRRIPTPAGSYWCSA